MAVTESTAPASSWDGGEGGHPRPRGRCSAPRRCPAPRRSSFGGDETKADPEALLVGALSSCHMLWFLALARKKGFEIASYEDDAEACSTASASPRRPCGPRVRWAGEPPDRTRSRRSTIAPHELCFIANSVKFPVEVGAGVSEPAALRRPVLDLTRLLPGGFCSLLLADLGAEVLKVEDTGMGDYIRWAPPYYGDDERPGARHPLGALPGAQPRQALGSARPQDRAGARGAAAPGRDATTSSSTASARRPRPARRRL